MKRLVSSSKHVALNVQRFADEIAASSEMQSRLGWVHIWYALRRPDGAWAFAPSKFVGYRDNSIKNYLQTYRKRDGGETERVLEALSAAVEAGSRLDRELTGALADFLDRWGAKPRRSSQIRLVVEEGFEMAVMPRRKIDETLLARISSDPAICGGRPCIKGTRMRVVDIVEALAHGATREELLHDFDYLTAEDIAAALLYSARASDHRVVHTA